MSSPGGGGDPPGGLVSECASLLEALCIVFFFFNDPAPPEIYTLSLHDALPISTKARIAQVARREFARRGFDATSIRQIVAEARVTQPVLYYYFKNKRDLFLSLPEEAVAPLCDEVERIAAGDGTPRDRMGGIIAAVA